MTISLQYILTWCRRSPDGIVSFTEEPLYCAFYDAMTALGKLAHESEFLFGQLLAFDGKVLANQAPITAELELSGGQWPGAVLSKPPRDPIDEV